MTEQEKARKAAELLVAWADGKKIERLAFFSNIKDQVFVDYKNNEAPEINSLNVECWSIKPEPIKQWYRVAIFKYHGDFITNVADNESEENSYKENKHFFKWITERIEYEVPSE